MNMVYCLIYKDTRDVCFPRLQLYTVGQDVGHIWIENSEKYIFYS